METETDSDSWRRLWSIGRTGWHLTNVNPFLSKHIDNLLKLNGKTCLQVFVPLCGKSIDMKYIYDLGHKVIGVEVVQKPCVDFFVENDIPFLSAQVPRINGIEYFSRDKSVRIFCCDILKFSAECAGSMDAVWDRCSFSAIDVSDRDKYCAVMKSLCTPSTNYLLDVLHYDQRYRSVPPFSSSVEEVNKHFVDFDVKILEHGYSDRTRNGVIVGGYGPWLSEYILDMKKKL